MHELKELGEEFERIKKDSKRYMSSYLKKALAITAKKVISKGPLLNIRPYEIEQNGFKKGKIIKEIPKKTKDIYVYHFDEQDRLLLIHEYGGESNIVDKEFYFYENNSIKRIHFSSPDDIRNIALSYMDEGFFKKDLNFGQYGWSISDYIYDDIFLRKISVRQKEHLDEEDSTFDVIFSYAQDGALEKIVNVFSEDYQDQRYP